MALEYRLTLAGSTPVHEVAERALPDQAERPTGTTTLISADLYDRYGFGVTITAGRNAYIAVETDEGLWEWEPTEYVSLTFRMDKFADAKGNVSNMLTAVRRVLDTGPEDATLVLNGDVLLLTRLNATLTKHHHNTWWTAYPTATETFPD